MASTSNRIDLMTRKILNGQCCINGCSNKAVLASGFLKPSEKLKPATTCHSHMTYGNGTHEGVIQSDKRWSCCGILEVNYYDKCPIFKQCIEEILRTTDIPITDEQLSARDADLKNLEDRINDHFCSENWDRS